MRRKKSKPGPGASPEENRPEGWESFAEAAEDGALASSEAFESSMRQIVEDGADDDTRAQGARKTTLASALQAELDSTKDQLLRLQADFENLRKRTAKERSDLHQYGHQALVTDLLTGLDNLERAVAAGREGGSGAVKSLQEGVELLLLDLVGALAKHGVEEVAAAGKPFDPTLHEAVTQAPDASLPANSVLEVLQKGYLLRGRLLRPARVVVSQTPASDEPENSSTEPAS